MAESIFREKSLDSIKSPDNLDQYIQVSHASGWILLFAILCLLIGAVVWGCFGTIETKETVQALVTDGTAVCNTSSDTIDNISMGMTIRIDKTEGKVWAVDDENNSVTAKIDVPDGVYVAEIITEVIKPMSLIFD